MGLSFHEMQAAAQEMSLRAVLDEDLSNYTLCDDGRYEVYTEYTDDAVSEVDKHKNITVNEEQCNLTQEENSQYVPFKLPRYWDGVDLMTKLIQFHYVNINGGSGISTAVNVRFNDSYIICGWLINKSVTAVAGDVTFEITATGTNEKSADYRWRTRPNGKFTVLEALSYDGIIEPSDDWYAGFVKSMQEYTTKAAESARSAQDYADQSKSNLDQVTQITETFTTNAQEVKETAINEINNAKVSGVNAVEAAATEIVNDREKITENANNISSLKGDIGYLQAGGIAPFMTDFFDLDYGVNRFNGSVTTGILKSDGTINPNNTNYCTTDYIYCSDMVGKYPIFSIYRTNLDIFFTYTYQVICFYDVKHKLLSKNGFYGGANVKPDSTVVPVGAVYLRFSTFALSTYPTDVFQLTFEETKTDPTVYTDYSEPKEIIKQKHIIDTNTDAFRDIAESYSVSTSKFLQSCAKTPMITWVDDDCNYNSIAEVKSLCDELEIKCTFGCITRDLSTAKILERLKEYQSNGFHIASHTHTHDRWYKDTTNGTMFTIDECEADLITSLCTLRENGFLDGDMMIFSGGSAQRDGVEEIVSKWCRCAVKTNGIVNHLYGDGRYFIRRVFINKSKGYDYYKGLIDEAISNGDWLVFGSHSYDTSETGFDFDLMRNILQYAKSQSVSIKTLNQAYKIRKSVYDFYELFN